MIRTASSTRIIRHVAGNATGARRCNRGFATARITSNNDSCTNSEYCDSAKTNDYHRQQRPTMRRSFYLNRIATTPTTAMGIGRRSMVTVTQTKRNEIPVVPPPSVKVVSNNEDAATTAAAISMDVKDASYTVTDSCWKRIEKLAAQKQLSLHDEIYLRLSVDAGGCSGFTYVFELVQDVDEAIDFDDDIVTIHPDSGARVAVDTTSLGFLQGSTLDFVVDMMKSAFEVRDNPNSQSACGCGSSFAVKNFEANPALD